MQPRVGVEPGPVEATIRRDPHGIPHILADDFKGIGFGYGYAFAEDNICTIAETYVTVRGERSRYEGNGVEGTFGPDGSYPQRGNGFGANNLNSDFFYQRIIDKGIIEDLLDAAGRRPGPVAEIREGVRGYVAGYNKYLADTGVNNLPDPRCRGEEWVKPIAEIDAYRRFYQLALLASQTRRDRRDRAARRRPAAPAGRSIPATIADAARASASRIGAIGSNAYGLGAEATDNGKGIVLGNPHFPWDGPERFYQTHLTIPGEINVSGASLYGVPLVLIGHTDNMAWSHTVSTAFRFTPFQETLDPADPTQYLYDGAVPRHDRGRGDGDGADAERRPRAADPDDLLDPPRPGLRQPRRGPAAVDAGGRVLDGRRQRGQLPLPEPLLRGQPGAERRRARRHREGATRGSPGSTRSPPTPPARPTTPTSARSRTSPNTKATDAATAPVGAATFAALGLPVLNGALGSCEWDTDADAVAPGIFGYDNLPKLFRDDYVTNSNDSYWLSNPEEPLEGYARIIGDEEHRALAADPDRAEDADRALRRTDRPAGDRPAQPPGRPGHRLQQPPVRGRALARRAGRALRDRARRHARRHRRRPVDVSGACPVLAAWDLHDDLDSTGAILFRRVRRPRAARRGRACRLVRATRPLFDDPVQP